MSQFGYGRRTCQGQAVTEADHIVAIGAIAWLFNIERQSKEPLIQRIMLSEKTSDFEEESVTGLSYHSSDDEDDVTPVIGRPFIRSILESIQQKAIQRIKVHRQREHRQVEKEEDPMLNFTTLLIAKPIPFKFNLKIRDEARAEMIQGLYADQKAKGEFVDAKKYCEFGDRFEDLFHDSNRF
jgi:hypothetical protein